MLSSDDLAQMTADLTKVRDDRDESLAFRRGDTTLDAQTVRIVRAGTAARDQVGAESSEQRARVLVLGPTDLDVAVGDRFNDGGGTLYRVTFVRPNRTVETVAEAEAVA
ncbi:MAG: hypothetical protein ACLFU8_06115 [Anaerolineales bacterium]